MIHIVAIVTAKPGMRQAILDALIPIVPTIHSEAGCLEYTIVSDADRVGAMHRQTRLGPDTFVLIEKWKTFDDVVAHSKADFVSEYFEKVEGLTSHQEVHFLEGAI